MDENNINIEINLDKCTDEILRAINSSLEEAVGVIQAQAMRNTAVDTGRTKASWETKVDGFNGVGYVGSNYENAIWEEFGTGIYAENGDGRKDVPWTYQAEDGTWHKTSGKKPRRALQKAFETKGKLVKKVFEERFGELK